MDRTTYVRVTWGASPTAGVTRYELEHRRSGTEGWTLGYRGPAREAILRLVVSGSVEIRVRACTASACSGYIPNPPRIVIETPTFPDYLPETCPAIPVSVPAQENVGAIAAETGVSGGASRVRIPIVGAPGRRGVQPDAALVYSSQGGGDVSGVGISLEGVSRIHRCARTPVHDGVVGSVDFTANDRLCLDGQRLVLVDDSDVYGATGSIYRTEIDSFARVTMHGAINGASSWFEVEEKSGTIKYYGAYKNTNALENYGTTTLNWWLRQTEDRQQNSIIYSYSRIQGQFVLSGMAYTGVGDTAGDRSYLYEYEPRPDKSTRYLAGHLLRTTQRLKSITTKVQSNVVRRYELGYGSPSPATGRSLLRTLTECTSNPCTAATRLPPTAFTYQDEAAAFQEEDLPDGAGEFVHLWLGSDYDGDGTRDSIRSERTDENDGTVDSRDLYLSSSGARPILGTGCEDHIERALELFPRPGNTDFDQDGRADLIGLSSGQFVICNFEGEEKTSNLTLPANTWKVHPHDFDGNGLTDLLVARSGQSELHLQLPSTTPDALSFGGAVSFPALAVDEQVVNVSDYDGNGLPDVLLDSLSSTPGQYEAKIVFTTIVNGTITFTAQTLAALGAPAGSFVGAHGRRGWFDLNSDGLVDIYSLADTNGSSNSSFWVNKGGAFQRITIAAGNLQVHDRLFDDVIQMDYDTDGISELLIPTESVEEFCYTLFEAAPDGGDEIYCSNGDTFHNFFSPNAPHSLDRTIYRFDAIELIDDGNGAYTITRVPTPVTAPLGSHSEDHFGDGLADMSYHLHRTWIAGPTFDPNHARVAGRFTDRSDYGQKVFRNVGPAPDLLTGIENGLGARANWSYAPLSAAGVPGCEPQGPDPIPFYQAHHDQQPDGQHFFFASSMYAVGRFEQSDGIGGMNPTCYRYEDAMYNTQGRGLLGFRTIIEEEANAVDPNNLRTVTTFHQKFPLISAVHETKIGLASDPLDSFPLERTTQHWSSTCTLTGLEEPPGEICFNFVDQTVKQTRDLDSRAWISTSTTTMTYEEGDDLDHGNLSWQETKLADRTTRYSERTDNSYDYSRTDVWWIQRLTATTVTTHSAEFVQAPTMLPASAFPENAPKVITTTYDYHPDSRLPLWQKVAGQQADEWVQTDFPEHDPYGNPKQLINTAALLPRPRTTALAYTTDGYFVRTQTEPLSHVSTFTTDVETGRVVLTVDPSNRSHSMKLDAFGRVLEIEEPGFPTAYQRVLGCPANACPPLARFRTLRQQDGAPRVTEFHDALG